MSETGTPSLKPRRLLLGMTCLTGVAVAISSAATQFVAYRVNYHPTLGTPLLGRFYAPWSWAEWMHAPWAAQAKTTFALVDAGLVGAVAVGMGAAFLISGKGRRRPTKHGGIHGTARFMTTEAEIRGSGLLPASVGAVDRMRGVREKPSAGVYVGGWTDKAGRGSKTGYSWSRVDVAGLGDGTLSFSGAVRDGSMCWRSGEAAGE